MQLPVIARDGYDRLFGEKTAGEPVRDHVLRLTFTSDDMFPFARDLGYTGLPFVWDAEERQHLRRPASTRCTSACTACREAMRATYSIRSR